MSPQINLLPYSCRRRNANMRYLRSWTGNLAMVFLLLTAASLILAERQNALANRSMELQPQVAPIQASLDSIAQLQRQAIEGKRVVETSRLLEQRDSSLVILQAIVAGCLELPESIRLTSVRVEDAGAFANKSEASKARLAATPQVLAPEQIRVPAKQVLLTGMAQEDADISKLLIALQTGDIFGEVTLESTQAIREPEGERRSFQIRCRY